MKTKTVFNSGFLILLLSSIYFGIIQNMAGVPTAMGVSLYIILYAYGSYPKD